MQALGLASPQQPGKILKVEIHGNKGEVNWKQDDAAFRVQMPAEKLIDAKLSDVGITLKVELA